MINNVLETFSFTIMKFRTCDHTSQFVLIQMEFRFVLSSSYFFILVF